jgi:hypothetical protein
MKINEYRHSASKGNDWYNNPSQWIYRHLLNNRSNTTPRMGMGNSAEFGCAISLFFDRSDAEVVEHSTGHMVNGLMRQIRLVLYHLTWLKVSRNNFQMQVSLTCFNVREGIGYQS